MWAAERENGDNVNKVPGPRHLGGKMQGGTHS